MHRLTPLLAVAAAAALLLSACAGGAGDGRAGDGRAGDGGDAAEPLTVPEALAQGSGEVTVTGSLVVADGEVRLCEVLLESFTPQCGGASLVVEDLDVEALPLAAEGDVAWSEGGALLQGELDDGVLRRTEVVDGAVT
jgi:hypothetical protein